METGGHRDTLRGPSVDVPAERLNRNWNELLQEIRVAQAGVQILFAFLLTLPFTQRWTQVTDFQRALYLITLLTVAAASALLIGPVAYHRMVFRRGARAQLVTAANTMALAGLVMLGVGINCAVLLIVDVVMGVLATALISSASVAFFVVLWWVLPRLTRPDRRDGGGSGRGPDHEMGGVAGSADGERV